VEYRDLETLTRDLSIGGIFVRCKAPLPEGSDCLFTLSFPGLEEGLTLKGLIRRVVKEPEEEAGMGVELCYADEVERRALRRLVRGLMYERLGGGLFEALGGAQGEEGGK